MGSHRRPRTNQPAAFFCGGQLWAEVHLARAGSSALLPNWLLVFVGPVGSMEKQYWRRGRAWGGAGAELTYPFGGSKLCNVYLGVAAAAQMPKPTRIQMVLPIGRGNC
jgi:hypothetical protein